MRLLELQPTSIRRRRNYTEIRLAQIVRLIRSPEPWTDKETTYVRLLQSCATLKALAEGKQVHSHMVKHGLKLNGHTWFLLISMYGDCGSFFEAHHTLQSMPNRSTDAWAALIASYDQRRLYSQALNTFDMMVQDQVSANEAMIAFALNACAGLVSLRDGMQIHYYIIANGHETSLIVQNSILRMYCKCHGVEHAERVFAGMEKRDEGSWTGLIMGYADHGLNEQAMLCFQQMLQARVRPSKPTFANILKSCTHLGTLNLGRGIHQHIKSVGLGSDALLNNMLITMYARCGSIREARMVFDRMLRKDITSWNAMLGAYAHHSLNKDTLKIFDRLKREVIKPDVLTTSIMTAVCSNVKDLVKSRDVHHYLMKKGFKGNMTVFDHVLDMYIKCAAIDEARQLFDGSRKRDVTIFNTMITGYMQLDRCEEALNLFCLMQKEGIEPNAATFAAMRNLCDSVMLEQGGS